MQMFPAFVAVLVSTIVTAQADPNINWGVTITSGTPPPPVVRYEPVPPPRPASVWIQGYWGWNGGAYVWIPGRWEAARPGYVYVQPTWREGPRGWELHQGGWRPNDPRHVDRERGGRADCPPGHRRKGEC